MYNQELMESVLAMMTVIVPVVTAVVEMIKRTFGVDGRLLPLISFVCGIAIGLAAYPFTSMSADLRMWVGALAGLAATGLFEVAFKKRQGTSK